MTLIKSAIVALCAVAMLFTAAPANAAVPANNSDVNAMIYLAELAWDGMDYYDTSNICDWYYEDPAAVRKEMAHDWYYDVFEREYSAADTRKAVAKFLREVC